MAITYSNTLKTSRMNAVVTAIGATGVLEIGTAGMAQVLATINLQNPAGTVANNGGNIELTFSGVPLSDLTADAGGTAAAARIKTSSAGTDVITGLTVGTSGTDIVLDNTNIAINQQITISSAVIRHA